MKRVSLFLMIHVSFLYFSVYSDDLQSLIYKRIDKTLRRSSRSLDTQLTTMNSGIGKLDLLLHEIDCDIASFESINDAVLLVNGPENLTTEVSFYTPETPGWVKDILVSSDGLSIVKKQNKYYIRAPQPHYYYSIEEGDHNLVIVLHQDKDAGELYGYNKKFRVFKRSPEYMINL